MVSAASPHTDLFLRDTNNDDDDDRRVLMDDLNITKGSVSIWININISIVVSLIVAVKKCMC